MTEQILSSGRDEICGDHGFVVEWETLEYRLSFKIHQIEGRYVDDNEISGLEEVISGWVKWDGCANILYDSGNYAHYCSPQGLIDQAVALRWVYEKAREMIPENQIDEWPAA